MRLRDTVRPVFNVWLPRTHVIVSLTLMSVVGETSERAAPKKVAKPVIVVSGIEFSKRPPPVTSCGYARCAVCWHGAPCPEAAAGEELLKLEAVSFAFPEIAGWRNALGHPRAGHFRFVDERRCDEPRV